MANTTRWEINLERTGLTFQSIEQTLMNLNGKIFESLSARYTNIVIEENKNLDCMINECQLKNDFNGKNFIYNFFSIKFDHYFLDENDPKEIKQLIILYEYNGKVFIIIDKNSGAQTLLRLILGFKGTNEIVQTSSNVNSNLIIWLIYKVYKKQIDFDLNEETLTLNTIIGFKGDTNDKLNTITASGDSLMNILSTLSFLLESNLLNQVSLRLEYTNHKNIEIKLDINKSLGISFHMYKGAFKKDSYQNISQVHQESLLYLFVYMEVFPIIKQWYLEDQEDLEDEITNRSKWDEVEHRKFLEEVAEDLTEKINYKVFNLENIISQL